VIPAGAFLLLASALAAACGSSPKTSYYTLDADTLPPVAAGANYSIVVGPVTLPETVDRPQLVVRASPNRVDIMDAHRWAEPLKAEIPRVIAANLARELGTARAAGYQQYTLANPDFTVLLDVQRFESALGESVTIEALWTIRRAGGSETRSGRSVVREPARDPGYDALVAAHSRALARVSVEIAEAVRGLGPPP
jgi:uncharacterized lipoprotein YmbA